MAEKYGRKVKELMVNEMKDIFSGNKGFVFSSMGNIKASDVSSFRKKVRQSGSKYFVIKNRLAAIALEEAGMTEFTDVLEENSTLGVGVIDDDPVKVAKLLTEFSKANKGFNVSKGYLEGDILTAERVKELSDLPGREQLIAMVVGMMNAPVTSFVGVLSSIVRSVMHVLNAIKDQAKTQLNESEGRDKL